MAVYLPSTCKALGSSPVQHTHTHTHTRTVRAGRVSAMELLTALMGVMGSDLPGKWLSQGTQGLC
jgi:hypothetical protein